MSQAQIISKPVVSQTNSVDVDQPVEKKSKWWIWILVVVVLALIGWGIYYWLM